MLLNFDRILICNKELNLFISHKHYLSNDPEQGSFNITI